MYNLYGWVPGFIGDYKYEQTITVKEGNFITAQLSAFLILLNSYNSRSFFYNLSAQPFLSWLRLINFIFSLFSSIAVGSAIALGDLVYSPPRSGPTLWEIGVPDRTAAEFYVPDPDPRYANKLYLNIDRYENTCTPGLHATSISNK